MIILDFGSGNTCRNDYREVRRMIDALADVDPKRRATIKWQLWTRGSEPQCSRLNWALFKRAYLYAEQRGFRTTSSVFDVESVRYLLTFDVPFVKIANRPYLRALARYVPRGVPIVGSYGPGEVELRALRDDIDIWMACVSSYPAEEKRYFGMDITGGCSDHTIGLDLWRKYKPAVFEKHYRLPDSTGPDAGPWAATPDEIAEVLA